MDRLATIKKWCVDNNRKVTSKQILQAVLTTYGFSWEQLDANNKKENIQARRCFWWLCKQLTPLNNERLGPMVGRCLSSVTYHIDKTKSLIASKDEDITHALWNVFHNLKQLQSEKV